MQRTENPWMPDRYGLLAPIIVRWSSGLRRLFAKQIWLKTIAGSNPARTAIFFGRIAQ